MNRSENNDADDIERLWWCVVSQLSRCPLKNHAVYCSASFKVELGEDDECDVVEERLEKGTN